MFFLNFNEVVNKYDFSRHYFSKHVYETYVPASSADSSFQNPNQNSKPIELKNDTITSNVDEDKIEKVSSVQHPNNESKEELKNDDITNEIVQNEPKNKLQQRKSLKESKKHR